MAGTLVAVGGIIVRVFAATVLIGLGSNGVTVGSGTAVGKVVTVGKEGTLVAVDDTTTIVGVTVGGKRVAVGSNVGSTVTDGTIVDVKVGTIIVDATTVDSAVGGKVGNTVATKDTLLGANVGGKLVAVLGAAGAAQAHKHKTNVAINTRFISAPHRHHHANFYALQGQPAQAHQPSRQQWRPHSR